MQLRHEGMREYTHWQQSIGAPGAVPGRDFHTVCSWSARKPKPGIDADSTRRRSPRVPPRVPRFELPRGTTVLGRSGAQPLPPDARQLHSARARLGFSGRSLGTPRGSNPRAPLPPGQVGRIKSNARLKPLAPKAPAPLSALMQLKEAFKRGEFAGATAANQAKASHACELARIAAEQVEKKRRALAKHQKEVNEVMASLRNAFREIDKDRSGAVEPGEVLALVKKSGQTVDEAKFWDNFNTVDQNHNGLIDEEEFVAVLTNDLHGPIRRLHSELSLLDSEAKAKGAEAEQVLEQVAKESAEAHRSGGASQAKTSSRASSRESRTSTNATTPREAARAVRGEGLWVGHAHLASSELQRMPAQPSSQGSPRGNLGERNEGSEWIQESVGQFKKFADLNKSITRLWQTAAKVDLVSLPPDSRLHSTIGRKNYEEDRKTWLREQETGAAKDVTVGVAINQFTGLFAANKA